MKKVEAIIRPSKLHDVQEELSNQGIPCITVVPVKGSGLQKSYSERYRGAEQTMILQTRIMIICVVSEENLEKCVQVIQEKAGTDSVGDGKIFVYNVEDAIRISTKIRGEDAIK